MQINTRLVCTSGRSQLETFPQTIYFFILLKFSWREVLLKVQIGGMFYFLLFLIYKAYIGKSSESIVCHEND